MKNIINMLEKERDNGNQVIYKDGNVYTAEKYKGVLKGRYLKLCKEGLIDMEEVSCKDYIEQEFKKTHEIDSIIKKIKVQIGYEDTDE